MMFPLKQGVFLFIFFQLNLFAQEVKFEFKKNQEFPIQGNQKRRYRVNLEKGELFQLQLLQKDVDIQILAISQNNDTIQKFDSPNGNNGLEIVELSIKKEGTYFFEVGPIIPKRFTDSIKKKYINDINGSYLVSDYKVFSPVEYSKLLITRKAKKDSVIRWIKDRSINIKNVKAETGFKDLKYLEPILKDVQIVGLGETSHGSKEVFQIKHRILEFLVKKMGFTVFAIEASHIGCQSINDYVLHGKGNSRDALTEQGFWIWNTEEVLDMIEWIRNYNISVPKENKVSFIGIDNQMVGLNSAYKRIGNFIRNTKTKNKRLLKIDVDSLFVGLRDKPDRNDMSLYRQNLNELLSYLTLNKAKLIHQTSKHQHDRVIKDLTKIIQGVEVADRRYRKTFDFNIRDEYMSQAVLDILQNGNPEVKIVLWAHNTHISKNAKTIITGKPGSLGSILKNLMNEQYYAIGFSTNQGSFRAMNFNAKERKYDKNAIFKLPPAKEESLDWYFAQTNKDIFFIDFINLSPTKTISTFLEKKRKAYLSGSSWSLDYGISPAFDISPGKCFDGMIFIKETSHSILTPDGEKEIIKRVANNKH
ncbi:erythromycin esterase family protein [Aquimarina aggregata]|uniref:erythromycin esterase family protein n=1 Tax=Aquimarina aggregata TaxID=1642818 RepID=UPI002493286B|nr:erythromycin esterase family protein [Aquimarina aggregata]